MQLEEEVVFVYLDETWIYQNGSTQRMWLNDSDLKANQKNNKTEGKQFTVLHACCKYGFLDGCSFLLNSKNQDLDYHKTMNGDIFKRWVENQLIPAMNKINKKCVVVMDNAPYHSVKSEKNEFQFI